MKVVALLSFLVAFGAALPTAKATVTTSTTTSATATTTTPLFTNRPKYCPWDGTKAKRCIGS
ncbi:hypothetical protein BT69DRAFT_1288254 [Atractiella rhizophila]|nr:hypothetical protein BT69DRAFT_1288254 [Atractiella rhizophila]